MNEEKSTMKVKLSYNDLTLILGLLENRSEELHKNINNIEFEIRDIQKEQATCWDSRMEEKAAKKYEELQNMLIADHEKLTELTGLINHLRRTR